MAEYADRNVFNATVQTINREISNNYVLTPTRFEVQRDLLLGLRRFGNAVRWAEFHRDRRKAGDFDEEDVQQQGESSEQ